MPRLTVTIDGPAGVGKSSLARAMAELLQIAYLDTGAMFRSLALALSLDYPAEVPEQTESALLAERLQKYHFALEGQGPQTHLRLNNRLIGQEIRTEEVGAMAARLAPLQAIREFLKLRQQELGENFDLVAEGRDMGTVVFPQACCKFFLDARPEVRAKRRFDQLQSQNMPADLTLLTKQIQERDDLDRKRSLAPLAPAVDAKIIDTSDFSVDEVFALLREHLSACSTTL